MTLFTATISYNNPKVLKESIDKYYELCYDKPDYHFVLNNNYPLHLEEQKEVFDYISKEYGCIVYNSGKNLGLKQGSMYLFNEVGKFHNFKDEDIIIVYDSNSYPITKNFDKALTDVFKNPEIGICSLTNKKRPIENIIQDKITNYNYYLNTVTSNISSITSISYKAHLILFFGFYMFSETYGDGSNYLQAYEKINKHNLKFVILNDYEENIHYLLSKQDFEYVKYKEFIIGVQPKDYISFDKYLELKLYNKIKNYTKINKNISLFTGETY